MFKQNKNIIENGIFNIQKNNNILNCNKHIKDQDKI